MRQELIQEAVEAVLATRDFCGNEDEAIEQAGNDLGIIFSGAEIIKIRQQANEAWLVYQRQCGARVLTSAERNKAYADLDADYLVIEESLR